MNLEETGLLRGERVGHSSRPGGGLSEFLRRSLKRQWRDYRKEFKRCRRKFSGKSVHQVRVSIRRLLSTLGVLASVIPGPDIAHAQRALTKRLKAFARLRDTHTQLLHVRKLRGHFPAAAEYHKALHRREDRLIKRVRRKLPRFKQGCLADSVAAIKKQLRSRAGDPAQEEKQFAATQNALRAAYANVVARHRATVPADTRTIHRTRVAFKKFRYMMEALQPLLPRVDEHQLQSMDRYQTRMGDIQDLVVLLSSVDKFMKKHHLTGARSAAVSKTSRSTPGEPTGCGWSRTTPPRSGGWGRFRAGLVRRRGVLVKRFMASRDELFEFYSFKPSHLESPNPSQRRRHHGTLHLAPRHRRPARRPRLRG